VKINKLHIGSFGKFKDYELELEDGFQIVYGQNEDGKSTLMAFIKMMFYSKLERGRDIDKNLRKKYQPWDGAMMNGVVEFEHAGISYRLQKDIGATPSSDKVKLINLDTGELISLGKTEEVGKRFFGLDLSGFERSAFINQIGSFSSNGKDDEVAEKLLSNLVLSGDDNISQQRVINRLNNGIEDMVSKNGKKGILVDARNELDSLKNQRVETQRLEDEQKENVEEYLRLKLKLDEIKNIQNLIKLNADKNRYEQITSLVNKINNFTELEKGLEKDIFPYNTLKVFINDCNTLIEESEKTKGSLGKLKGQIEVHGNVKDKLIPISQEEYKSLKKLTEQKKTLIVLLKRIDDSFIPVLLSFINAKNNYKDIDIKLKQEIEIVEQLKKFHEDFQKYEEEKNRRIEEKADLIKRFEMDELQWNADKKLREQQIKFTMDKVSAQASTSESVSQKNHKLNGLMILSCIIGIISIISAVFIGRLAAIGVFGAVVIAIYAKKVDKQGQRVNKGIKSSFVFDLEQVLQDLKNKNQQEEELINNTKQQHENRIRIITDVINGIEEELKVLSQKNREYQDKLNKCSELKNKKAVAAGNLETRKEVYHQEMKYLFSNDIISEDLTEMDAADYKNRITSLYKNIELKIQCQMQAKSCTSMKEYEDKYLEYASNLKNQSTIIEAETEYLKKTEEVINKVNEYEIIQNYEDAKELIWKLSVKTNELENERTEALNIAKGMGYDAPSLDYLKGESEKLLPSIKSLDEMEAESFAVEELLQMQKEMEESNLEELYYDLQKKIRTPDKNLSQVQEEIDAKQKDVNEKTDYYDSLKVAAEVMQEASDEMRMSFGPQLNKRTSEIFNSLTNGKYGKILVTKDYDIAVQSGIHYREWRYLSNGTIDQAYLALRLAITELISDKNIPLPLFLDDVLIQYDDKRIETALDFLSDYANKKGDKFQLILFTCHLHIIEYAKPFISEVVNI